MTGIVPSRNGSRCHGRHQATATAVVHPRRVVTTLMFTDIVDSTGLLSAAGDDVWADLVLWHDLSVRSLVRASGGREVKQVGDGFFVVFDHLVSAVSCAQAIVSLLADPGQGHPALPVRVGIHRAEVVQLGRDYVGRGVHEAARITAMAAGGEILVSASSLNGDANRIATVARRTVALRGLAEAMEVVTIDGSPNGAEPS